MANASALLLNVLRSNKPKGLTGLAHKGGGQVETLPHRLPQMLRHRRTGSASLIQGTRAERGKPVALLSPEREESREADPWRCGYGGGKKRRPSCHETDTGCARGLGNITRRASGQTSLRCLGTRTREESIQKVWQRTVASGHWGYLPRKGIDVCQVSCSQQVVGLLTGLSHGLRDA
jgi:hypothetical protein